MPRLYLFLFLLALSFPSFSLRAAGSEGAEILCQNGLSFNVPLAEARRGKVVSPEGTVRVILRYRDETPDALGGYLALESTVGGSKVSATSYIFDGGGARVQLSVSEEARKVSVLCVFGSSVLNLRSLEHPAASRPSTLRLRN